VRLTSILSPLRKVSLLDFTVGSVLLKVHPFRVTHVHISMTISMWNQALSFLLRHFHIYPVFVVAAVLVLLLLLKYRCIVGLPVCNATQMHQMVVETDN
jgi:hypothetical protein